MKCPMAFNIITINGNGYPLNAELLNCIKHECSAYREETIDCVNVVFTAREIAKACGAVSQSTQPVKKWKCMMMPNAEWKEVKE